MYMVVMQIRVTAVVAVYIVDTCLHILHHELDCEIQAITIMVSQADTPETPELSGC